MWSIPDQNPGCPVLVGRVFANGLGDQASIPGWVIPKTLKNGTWCLLTQHYKVHTKGKVEQSRGRSSTLPYTSVKAIEKGAFRSHSNTVANLLSSHTPVAISHLLKVMSDKAWNAIDRLITIMKSDLSDKIKLEFFQAVAHISAIVWLHHLDFNKTPG